MSRFASETNVPVERSRAEVEQTLRRYGATEFSTGWNPTSFMIAFRLDQLFIRFILPMPDKTERRFTHKKLRGRENKMSEIQQTRAYEQDIRSRWRALLLVVKAKLEAVECGISTVEQEFLSFVVMPNQMTVGEWIITEAMPMIAQGQMPRLALRAPKGEVEDAEFEEKK